MSRGLTLRVTNTSSSNVSFTDILESVPLSPGGVAEYLYTEDTQKSFEYGSLNTALLKGTVTAAFVSGSVLSLTPIGSTLRGSTPTGDGQRGLVPQPLVTNRGSYLKGDGTWSILDAATLGAIPESKLTTKGDLLVRGPTTSQRLPLGSQGRVFRVGATGLPEWHVTAWSDTVDNKPFPSLEYLGKYYWNTSGAPGFEPSVCLYNGAAYIWEDLHTSTYKLPFYVVGDPSSGPGTGSILSSPQFATIAAAVAQYIVDGHTSATIHLLEGNYTWTGTLPLGLSLRGPMDPRTCIITGDITILATSGSIVLENLLLMGTLLNGVGVATTSTVILRNVYVFAQTPGSPAVGNFDTGASFILRSVGLSTRDGATAQHAFAGDARCSLDAEHCNFSAPDTHASIYLNVANSSATLVDCSLRGRALTNNTATLNLTNMSVTLNGALNHQIVSSAAGTTLYIHGYLKTINAAADVMVLSGGGTLLADSGVFLGGIQTASLQPPTNSGVLVWVTDGANVNGVLGAGSGVLATWNSGTAAWEPFGGPFAITGQTLGDLLTFDGTDWNRLAPSGAGQVLTDNGVGVAPTFSAPALPQDLSIAAQTTGDLLYFNGVNWVRLPAGALGEVLTGQGVGVAPLWAVSSGGVTVGTYAARPAPGAAGGLAGNFYLVADPGNVRNSVLYESNGTDWRPVRYNRRPVYPSVGKLHWHFTEANGAVTVVNTGTLVGNDLTVAVPNRLGEPSQWDGETGLAQVGANAQKAYGALGQVGTVASTLIVWFTPYTLQGWSAIVSKAYSNGAWISPFAALSIYMTNANSGSIEFGVAYGGGLRLTVTALVPMSQRNELTMLALVWNGATGTIDGYVNGVFAITGTVGGPQTIDYGVDPGPWGVSGHGVAADAAELAPGKYQDVWADDVILSAAQIAEVYQRGVGAWGG